MGDAIQVIAGSGLQVAEVGTRVARVGDQLARVQYARELGQRLHIIRRVRRRGTEEVSQMLHLRPVDLHNLEQGNAIPTALLLHRFAAVLQVPVPLLVDPAATPQKVLRVLARDHP